MSKPFTSETLVNAVRSYLGDEEIVPGEIRPVAREHSQLPPAAGPPWPAPAETAVTGSRVKATDAPEVSMVEGETSGRIAADTTSNPVPFAIPDPSSNQLPFPESPLAEGALGAVSGSAYFSGDSSFFSLYLALQTIAHEKLTGILRAFWKLDPIELLARDGGVVMVTTRNPTLYCEETPVALPHLERERIATAGARQAEDGCPIFVTLTQEGLILREPAIQLIQHYGQKLFSQLWTNPVRFSFEQQELPGYGRDLPSSGDRIDQWALGTLRFVQYEELGTKAMAETSSVPAYTRDGGERVQELRLTVSEAQFASQINGSLSVAQISENLQLDIKSAQLTLFCFLALEIVECWPAPSLPEPESRRGLRGMFGR